MTDREFQAKLDDCEVEEEYPVCKSECLRARASEARLIEALKACLPLLTSDQEKVAWAQQAPAAHSVNPLLGQAIGQTDDRLRAREIIRAALKGAE